MFPDHGDLSPPGQYSINFFARRLQSPVATLANSVLLPADSQSRGAPLWSSPPIHWKERCVEFRIKVGDIVIVPDSDGDCRDMTQARRDELALPSPKDARNLFRGEDQLLEAFRAGELSALTEVYCRCRQPVLKLIRCGFVIRRPPLRLIPGVVDAWTQEDHLQEVFIRAFSERGRQQYDGIQRYLPYLRQIARNLRIDAHRRSSRETLAAPTHTADALVLDAGAKDAQSAGLQPEELLDYRRGQQLVRDSLRALSPIERHFVQVRFLEELSQNDSAVALGLDRGHVRTLERRILRLVRKRFGSRRALIPRTSGPVSVLI